MSDDDTEDRAEEDTSKRARKTIVGMAVGAIVTTICPPVGVAIGAASVLGSARKYAHSGDPVDALGMVTGTDDLTPSSEND